MKNYALSLFILLISFTGCSKDGSNPVTDTPPPSLTINGVQGKIYNWMLGSSMLTKFSSFGSSSIDEAGNFQITNFSSPYGNQLSSILNYYVGFTQQPTISDPETKMYMITTLAVVSGSDPTTSVGLIQKGASTSSITTYIVGEYFTYYVYIDRPVTIDGVSAWTANGRNFKEIYKKVTFEKGWNKFVNKIFSVDLTTKTISLEIAREEPTEGVWCYLSLSSTQNSVINDRPSQYNNMMQMN